MRVTRSQLRRIIAHEKLGEGFGGGLGKALASYSSAEAKSKEKPSISISTDMAIPEADEDTDLEEEDMKEHRRRPTSQLTKAQLKRVIREEARNLLNTSKFMDAYMTPAQDVIESDEDESDELIGTTDKLYGKDYLSKTHTDGEGEEADPRLDYGDEDLGESLRRRIHEVEYAMDDDPVGRFTLELENAWDGALQQDAMESELAMVVEMFLQDRGFM